MNKSRDKGEVKKILEERQREMEGWDGGLRERAREREGGQGLPHSATEKTAINNLHHLSPRAPLDHSTNRADKLRQKHTHARAAHTHRHADSQTHTPLSAAPVPTTSLLRSQAAAADNNRLSREHQTPTIHNACFIFNTHCHFSSLDSRRWEIACF